MIQDQPKQVTIDRLGIHGEGVARLDGLALFVDGALPGETVTTTIYERRKTFAKARSLAWHSRSPHRQTPPCPLFGQCGGCQLMHLSYAQQLEAKRTRVVDAMERIAKLPVVNVLPCTASPQPLAYRNKIQLPLSANHRLGLYARNTHDIVEIDHCQIHCPLGEKVFQHIQSLIKDDPQVHNLKHVLIKTALNTEQVLVVFVTKNATPLASLASQLMHAAAEIKGVVQNINPSENNTVLSSDFHILAGQGWIEERLCGLRFKVSPASFFQVNPPQAEALYEKVLEFAQITRAHTVLDAFCGVGTLALLCARQAKQVMGIEIVPQAILDAEENSRNNQIENATFLCGKAEENIAFLETIDIAILNPPRKGCERALLEALIKQQVPRIVYVSCDPATLARDLAILVHAGYQLGSPLQPFDMFPQTMHVECVAVLEKQQNLS